MLSPKDALRPAGFAVIAVAVFSIFFNSIAVRTNAIADSPKSPDTVAEISFGEFNAESNGDSVRLRWSTTFEVNVVGFNIWRIHDGDRRMVNREPVGASIAKVANGVLVAGDEYEYFDSKAVDGATYEIEALLLSGESRFLEPAPLERKYPAETEPMRRPLPSIASIAQIDKVDFPDYYRDSDAGKFFDDGAESAFPANGGALKFEVRRSGWYRVPAATLQANGFPASASGSWKLYRDGREVAITITADGSIEFYGNGIDTIQSDASVYWFISGSGNGRRTSRSSSKYSSSAPNGWTRTVAERRDKTMRISSVLNGARDNWFAGYVGPTESVSTLNLSEIATESNESALIGVDLQGLGTVAHSVSVTLNGTPIGQIGFSDVQRSEWSTAVPVSLLRAGANEVRLKSSASNDYSVLEAVRINYPRRLVADGNRLQFSLASRKAGKIRGFNSSRIRVFDITNHDSVSEINPATRLEADGTYSATIGAASGARLFIAQGDSATPMSVERTSTNAVSSLKSATNSARLLLIAPTRFHADLQVLRNAREAQGLPTMMVDPTDIYDEFSYGVTSAEAIRSFLSYAKSNWTVKPEFVIFVGDASTDPRNYTGNGGPDANIVPTMLTDTWNMEAVTDVAIADFDNDGLENLAIGRVPVRTSTELNTVLNKILVHDATSNEQVLNRGALMVSDANAGYNFEAAARNIAGSLPSSAQVSYADLSANDPTVFRQNLLASMNNGPAVVNYFGHGAVTFWTSRQIYRTGDAAALSNYSQPSLVVMLACLSGSFAEPGGDSLSVATMKSPTGGAFGVWAASGWNGAADEEIMGREYFQRIYSGVPIGEAARQVKALFPNLDLRRTFLYFGDPSQRLIR